MPDRARETLRVDPARLSAAIVAYERAADRVGLIVSDIVQSGRLSTPWAQDRVSIAMAAHYNEQVFDGEGSTYRSLRRYEAELRSVADTLREMRDSYLAADAEAVSALRLPAHATGGR